MKIEIESGDRVKLKSFEDEDFGSCEYLARLAGVDLSTELKVVRVCWKLGSQFLTFSAPHDRLSGMSAQRFVKICS